MKISRLALASVAVVVALTLSACVKLHSESAFSDHNTVTQTVVVAVDPDVLSQVGADPSDLSVEAFQRRIPAEQSSRVTVEDYVDGELKGVRIEARDLTFEELASASDVLAGQAQGDDNGFGPGDLLGGAVAPSVERQGDQYVVTIPALQGEASSIPGVNASSLGRFINFEAKFTFPGPVVSSTHGKVNGKTVTLSFEDIQSGQDITIRAVASEAIAWGPLITWAIIALAVLVIIGGGIALAIIELRKRRPNLPEPEPTDGTGIGVLDLPDESAPQK